MEQYFGLIKIIQEVIMVLTKACSEALTARKDFEKRNRITGYLIIAEEELKKCRKHIRY